MAKILIFIASRTEQENYILQKKVEVLSEEFRNIGFVGVHPMGLPASIDSQAGLVIMNLPEWTTREAECLSDLAKVGYRGPVLVLVKADVKHLTATVRSPLNVVFVEKPTELSNLLGIAKKMLTTRMVAQQVHKRYQTSQTAEVEFVGRASRVLSRVRNLSKGGAMIEFVSQAPVRVGERVSLKLELKDLNRTYTMQAKVMWTAPGSSRESMSAGVEFLGGDVKKQIIGL